MSIFTRLAVLILSAAVVTTGAPIAQADLVPNAVEITPSAIVSHFWKTNYFKTKQTCEARGRALTSPTHPDYLEDSVDFACMRRNGESKWSILIYFVV